MLTNLIRRIVQAMTLSLVLTGAGLVALAQTPTATPPTNPTQQDATRPPGTEQTAPQAPPGTSVSPQQTPQQGQPAPGATPPKGQTPPSTGQTDQTTTQTGQEPTEPQLPALELKPLPPMPPLTRLGVTSDNTLTLSLNDAIRRALENNNDIEVARGDVRFAETTLRSLQGVYDPVFTYNPQINNLVQSQQSTLGGATGSSGTVSQTDIQTNTSIDKFF